ncbi:DUF2950 family protein [Terracidiphilus sp.]|uniref:DUF2950 family protein n=1 Tax=Terracidiphilus sp. TaxID=1964191 RepID=UPI003C272401
MTVPLLEVGLMLGCRSKHSEGKAAQVSSFATPEEAGEVLAKAAKGNDDAELLRVLGPDSKQILSSGDAKEDQGALADFAAKYQQMNRWAAMTDGSEILFIGADNYPFPIPLVSDGQGRWRFDTEKGKDEILARRIGENELLGIDAANAMAGAEELYRRQAHDGNPAGQYTTLILSTAGKQNGLYWEVPHDKPSSPLGRLNEFAQDVIHSTPSGAAPIFDGYEFRIFTVAPNKTQSNDQSQSDAEKAKSEFVVVAAPVEYDNSGIMTFIAGKDGVVYQKDLGKDTREIAASISSYKPGDGWARADQ